MPSIEEISSTPNADLPADDLQSISSESTSLKIQIVEETPKSNNDTTTQKSKTEESALSKYSGPR